MKLFRSWTLLTKASPIIKKNRPLLTREEKHEWFWVLGHLVFSTQLSAGFGEHLSKIEA